MALPGINRPWNGPVCGRALYPYLKALEPNLVLNYWVYPEGYAGLKAAQGLGVPGIVSARGSDLRRIEDPLTRRRISQTLRGASFVLTVSEELRGRAIGLGADPDRTVTILNGRDGEIFHFQDRGAARAQLGVDEGSRMILYVGRLTAAKGILDLVEAFSRLTRDLPNLRLVLAGAGPLESSVEGLARRLGVWDRLRLTGEQPPARVALWMAAADLFCLPSHSEGCPNVLIEAISSGCPAVGADVGGVPELLTPECGILVPAHSVPRLAEGLRTGLSRTWDRATISRNFRRTWDDVAKETYAICQEALEGRARRKTPATAGRRVRITVVTSPHRRYASFEILRRLKSLAELKILCPLTVASADRPDDLDATFVRYPAAGLIADSVNGLICEQYLMPHARAARPDIILSYGLYPEGFSAVRIGRKLRVPVVVGAIGSDVDRGGAYRRHLVHKTLTEASGVIAAGAVLSRQAVSLGAPPDRVTTIWNGCDTAAFRSGGRHEARRVLEIAEDAELILDREAPCAEGIVELMDAFVAVSRVRPKARLAVLGGSESAELVRTSAGKAGVGDRLLLPGPQDPANAARWLEACDVVCQSTYTEGSADWILEARSCGRPVVAVHTGDLPELVHDHEGILFPPHDAGGLSAALASALASAWDAERISRGARDWALVAEETFAVCSKVLDLTVSGMAR